MKWTFGRCFNVEFGSFHKQCLQAIGNGPKINQTINLRRNVFSSQMRLELDWSCRVEAWPSPWMHLSKIYGSTTICESYLRDKRIFPVTKLLRPFEPIASKRPPTSQCRNRKWNEKTTRHTTNDNNNKIKVKRKTYQQPIEHVLRHYSRHASQ